MKYDLCLPWYWEYDADFVRFVRNACEEHDLSFWEITPNNLLESTTALYLGETTFKTLLHRGQGEARFDPIPRWAREHGARRINPAEVSAWSEDKATMHLEFINSGLHTPYTILLAPFIEQPVIPQLDLRPLGERFVIKPSNGGGGEGVIIGASSLNEILHARLEFPEQKYLIQAQVTPRAFHYEYSEGAGTPRAFHYEYSEGAGTPRAFHYEYSEGAGTPRMIEDRPAWFRVFYAHGETYPCWWSTDSHAYANVTAEEEAHFGLSRLGDVAKRIASICKLDWFSTEIALTDEFIVVDYVNDEIDTRIQSQAADGVPDDVMENIARQLVLIAKEHK